MIATGKTLSYLSTQFSGLGMIFPSVGRRYGSISLYRFGTVGGGTMLSQRAYTGFWVGGHGLHELEDSVC